VKIGELRDHLSRHLQRVRRGQELVVLDRNRPIARIVPVERAESDDADLEQLAAEGRVRLPRESIDWRSFDRLPFPRVRGNALLDALLGERDGE
jgi:prevent-host-death family protein